MFDFNLDPDAINAYVADYSLATDYPNAGSSYSDTHSKVYDAVLNALDQPISPEERQWAITVVKRMATDENELVRVEASTFFENLNPQEFPKCIGTIALLSRDKDPEVQERAMRVARDWHKQATHPAVRSCLAKLFNT